MGGGGGDVHDLKLAIGAGRVLFRAEGEALGTLDLYSVPSGGGVQTKLSPSLPDGARVAADFLLSPDGQSVFFRADAEVVGEWNLYHAPVDGSAAAQRLNDPLAPGETVSFFDVTPDGSRVVFLAGDDDSLDYELRGVSLHGTESPVTIAGATPEGRVEAFEITPDSLCAVFKELSPGSSVIGAVALDGSASAVFLADGTGVSIHSELGVGLDHVDIAPDSDTVALIAGLESAARFDLFRVTISNPTVRTKINGPMVPGANVQSIDIAPDGVRVVYTADQLRDETVELFSVPLDGSVWPTRLNGVSTPEGTVISEFKIRDDSQMVLYRGRPTSTVYHLYRVPMLGGVPPNQLHGVLDYVNGPFEFTANGNSAVFLGSNDIASHVQLYSVPIDLSSPALLLTWNLGVDSGVDRFAQNGTEVVFRADPTPGRKELLVVPRDGAAAPLVLNAPLPADADVLSFECDGSFVYFVADAFEEDRFELFRVPIDGASAPVRLNEALAAPDAPQVKEVALPNQAPLRTPRGSRG